MPADSEKIIMRYVISRQEAEQLIGEIDGMDMIPIDNERQREETLKKALRTCDTRQWVRVIKTINVRREKRLAQGKKVTAGDENAACTRTRKTFSVSSLFRWGLKKTRLSPIYERRERNTNKESIDISLLFVDDRR